MSEEWKDIESNIKTAKRYGVSKTTVLKIRNCQKWKHLKDYHDPQ